MSASKYAYIGGFDGTSNVLAGKLYGIPVKGTHAHSYVTSFNGASDTNFGDWKIRHRTSHDTIEVNFYDKCVEWRNKLADSLKLLASEANDGELAAFASYAVAFPSGFLALVDTYDVNRSGVLNFAAVAMALYDLDYMALGIRIDSGDLAYLSRMTRETLKKIATEFNVLWFAKVKIVVSNDINEDTILSLNDQGHSIDCFGIGTHLVTCQKQPALGCVYKLVEIKGNPKIKLSHDLEKVTVPGKKSAYRLYGLMGHALLDLLQRPDETIPEVGKPVLCRHPFEEFTRTYVKPTKVEQLYTCWWENGQVPLEVPTLAAIRSTVLSSLQNLREDHKRSLNPTPYKVSVSDKLYSLINKLRSENQPIGELS